MALIVTSMPPLFLRQKTGSESYQERGFNKDFLLTKRIIAAATPETTANAARTIGIGFNLGKPRLEDLCQGTPDSESRQDVHNFTAGLDKSGTDFGFDE